MNDTELEKLLQELYLDNDEMAEDDIIIIGWPLIPNFLTYPSCCTVSYLNYSS